MDLRDIKDTRELVANLFPTYGPFSHAQTARAASLIGELVRYLNYATADSSGLPGPGTVYDVIGSLRSALDMLDQTCDQLADGFDAMAGDPNAEVRNIGAEDARWPFRNAFGTADNVNAALTAVRPALRSASRSLGDAQVYAGRLSIVDPDEED